MAAERKEKYWGAERNAKRREQYHTDVDVAERVREQRRDSYRRRNEDAAPLTSCSDNVAKVPTSGALMAVQLNGGGPLVIGRVFMQTELADLLDRQPPVIYRWNQRGMFPPPVLVDDKGNRYYSDVEVTDFVTILGEHQKKTRHYRADHDLIRNQLFGASFFGNAGRADQWIAERTK